MGTFSRVFSSLGKGSHPPKLHLYLKVLGQNKKKGDHPDEETHTMLINMYAYKYIVHTYIHTYIYNHIWAFAFLSSLYSIYTYIDVRCMYNISHIRDTMLVGKSLPAKRRLALFSERQRCWTSKRRRPCARAISPWTSAVARRPMKRKGTERGRKGDMAMEL
jgi:hypothetical protein